MTKFSYKDLIQLLDLAKTDLLGLSDRGRLPGMNRDLRPVERQALAFYHASITLLNSKGAIGIKNPAELLAALFTPDSESSSD